MRGFSRVLDVLWVDVAATEDDQVLEPPAHVQLALVQKAEVAAAQVVGARGVAADGGLEGLAAELGPALVALRLARAAHPDLAHRQARVMRDASVGVDNHGRYTFS